MARWNSDHTDLDDHENFERSFDFSRCPILREVTLGLGWVGGSPRWVPIALSTVDSVTSPRLSVIRLSLTCSKDSTRISIEGLGNELRRTTDEVFRIKHEFGGMDD